MGLQQPNPVPWDFFPEKPIGLENALPGVPEHQHQTGSDAQQYRAFQQRQQRILGGARAGANLFKHAGGPKGSQISSERLMMSPACNRHWASAASRLRKKRR